MSNFENKHPVDELKDLSKEWGLYFNSESFAVELDKRNFYPTNREKFYYPKLNELPKVDLSLINDPSDECIYFCGNSLGLQPKEARINVEKEFEKWAKIGVYGHLEGDLPWASCEDVLNPLMAKIVGAKTEEVNVMNFLTVNLHIMMISFYRPTAQKFKILIEDKAFPSDYYAVESQIKLHNLDPKECIIFIKPREGETYFRTEDILRIIEIEGQNLSLVLLSGVQYFTGQFFDIRTITEAAHKQNAYIGWDLAHAVGNCEIQLHNWNVDFAVWCSYKYLNGGAGSIGGIFLHEKHFENIHNFKKLDGWWSHKFSTRFEMSNNMEYAKGALAYGLSNTSMLLTSCLKASLDIFNDVGMKALKKRSRALTAFMEVLLLELKSEEGNIDMFDILTPTDPNERGSQLSIRFKNNISVVHKEIEKRGIVCDFREPDVLRFAPTALYNNFSEIYRFVDVLRKCLSIIFKN